MFPRPDPSVSEDLPAVLAVRLAVHVLSVLSAVVFPVPPLGYVNNEGREFRDLVAVLLRHRSNHRRTIAGRSRRC